jgi:CubicO group peptidase (beta-lactamase class C family)
MRRRDFIRLLGGAALEPFSMSPVFAGSPSGCGVPVARDDGWPVASINGDMVIDRGTLCKITDRLAASSTANVHVVLVARGGKLVFERYFRGSDEIYGRPVGNVTFDADTLNDMKSVSKSVASLAVGIAIDRGLKGSTNEPIFSFFPELSGLRSPEKERIQLLHALTLSMGLEWVEATPYNEGNNDEERMHRAPDPCRYVLGLASTAPAGQEFFYNTGALTLVSAMMRKATGRTLDEFGRATLFEPMGITGVEWIRVKGDTDAAAPKIEGTSGLFYGYLLWLGRSLLNGREIQWIMAADRGGQSIRVVPELDLVVVITAGYYQDYRPQAFQLR